LDIRRQVRDRIEVELTDLRRLLDAAAASKEELVNRRRECVEEFRSRLALNIEEIKIYHHFVDGLAEKIRSAEEEVIELEKQVEEKIVELLEAKKNEQAMERLREKEWMRYRREATRKEIAFLDEIAVRRYFDATAERE
jgi:flagellar export protein FliJ